MTAPTKNVASSTGGHSVTADPSVPYSGKENDTHSEVNIEMEKNTNVSVDDGSNSATNGSISVNKGLKNDSQLGDVIKLSNVTANSSTSSGSEDSVNLKDTVRNSSVSNGSESINSMENKANSVRRLLEERGSTGANDGNENVQTATVENEEVLEAEADSSFELFRDTDELADEYSYDYDDYVDENMWGDEDWVESQHEKEEDYVAVDSHILCTPVSITATSTESHLIYTNQLKFIFDLYQVIADIDNDGVSEMVVAVSYFFDRE